ncbi:MAG TPA: hypothetical protein VH307_10455 [Streptosporangiaceae bacterium]|nr:hypothetical protein [Streptosporangiaceae bacterium]
MPTIGMGGPRPDSPADAGPGGDPPGPGPGPNFWPALARPPAPGPPAAPAPRPAFPLAAVAMYPDRRFDDVLSAWPRRGGAGHPVRCQLLGVLLADQPQLSDHYGVLADLRY